MPEVVVQSIVLPNAQTGTFTNSTAWEFEYNDQDSTGIYGCLTKVTFPTGGSISYTYQLLGDTWDLQRSVATRTVNDGTTPNTWTYSYSVSGGNTTITAPKLNYDSAANDIFYTIIGGKFDSRFEISAAYYQGSKSTGALLKTDAKTTTSISNPNYTSSSTTPGFGPQIAGQIVTQQTTTWASGLVSQVQTSFDSGFSITSSNGAPLTGYPYGLEIQSKSFDYGSGGAGPLLRQTNTAYMALSGPNAAQYLSNNLLSPPYTVQTLNGAGTQVALTQFNYDETARDSSGLTSSNQWDSAPLNGNYRGNNTSAYKWLNSGSLTCPSGSSGGSGSNVISYKVFFDDGNVQTATDPCGNATTYAYSLTYWAALPTTVTNALNQATNNTYDFNSGVLASTSDPNNLSTSFAYDNMRRLVSATAPDGAVTTITRQETTFPFSATINKPINPSQTQTSTNVFDGLGRVKQKQLNSDPQGVVYTDTTYDQVGRVSTVSNPYRSGTDITTTTGTTTLTYNALGQKTSETYPDTSVLKTAYCGPSTLVTDPTNRWRRSRVDGLGRLVEADEPNSTTATVASTGCPGSGEPIGSPLTPWTLLAT